MLNALALAYDLMKKGSRHPDEAALAHPVFALAFDLMKKGSHSIESNGCKTLLHRLRCNATQRLPGPVEGAGLACNIAMAS